MSTLLHAQNWIENAWLAMGRDFGASCVPVARFHKLVVDDLSFPFKSQTVDSWFLREGKLVGDSTAKIDRVPFVAFSVDDAKNTMNIQVQWASRCGYGFEIAFDDNGAVLSQRMRWVS